MQACDGLLDGLGVHPSRAELPQDGRGQQVGGRCWEPPLWARHVQLSSNAASWEGATPGLRHKL